MNDIKLNLGCGEKRLPGYLNVDKFGTPDLKHDLELVSHGHGKLILYQKLH